MSSSPRRYDAFSQALHWLTAVTVLITFILGPGEFSRLVHQGIDPATHSDIVWHETLGMVVLALTLLRLIWVALRPAAPEHPIQKWMRMTAKVMQGSLWLLLFALPLTAILTLVRGAQPLNLLGRLRVDLPSLLSSSALVMRVDWGDVHGFLGDAVIWLAGLHAVAAIYHHFGLRDHVLSSMLPPRRNDR